MYISQAVWTRESGWSPQGEKAGLPGRAQLVFVFGSREAISNTEVMGALREAHPGAYVCGCSTAGEIYGSHVVDDSLVATAVQFNSTIVRGSSVTISDPKESYSVGERLASSIPHEGLVHTFVLSDGLSVNGSELVKGLTHKLPRGVVVTGGLAGDGARFAETRVCADGVVAAKQVAIVGFYGDRIKVGFGSMGGWDPFGPERQITRSKGNVLYELDGRSALDLYKEYLMEHAANLPASGLLFPLSLREGSSQDTVVRTILAVNEEEKSMTFAGDMPEGGISRLMRANFDRLVDGAAGAARKCYEGIAGGNAQLAILISCVGRKLVLKQRIEEEVEGALEVLGQQTVTTGFYSYGEISPFTPDAQCALHNQTMTITTFSEE